MGYLSYKKYVRYFDLHQSNYRNGDPQKIRKTWMTCFETKIK